VGNSQGDGIEEAVAVVAVAEAVAVAVAVAKIGLTVTLLPAILVTKRARELGHTTFESSSKMI